MDEQEATRPVRRIDGSPSDPTSRIGTLLAGRCRILTLLGEGGQGTVYVGEHLKTGRREAIKVLRPELMKDPEAVARFTRGASKASFISHPNVCTVYDVAETEDGLPFIASELVDGRELQDIMKEEGPFPLNRAADLVEQIAAGLNAAHELGIVHRDLKPANVMVQTSRAGREVVKVVDFDIAKGIGEAEASSLTQVGWIIGTPRYMSPEQLTGGELDGRSDIYSLGLILFELLTGESPNDVTSSQRLMWARVNDPPRTLQEAMPQGTFPPGLQAALDAALAADRELRPQTALEFAQRIRAVIPERVHAKISEPPTDRDATVTLPREAGDGSLSKGRVSRKPYRMVAAGVGALAAVVVGASLSLGDLGSAPPLALMVPGPIQIEAGGTQGLDVQLVTRETGEEVAGEIAFSTTDTSVATVDEAGVLHAVAVGSTTVIMGAAGLTKQVDVTVMDAAELSVGASNMDESRRQTTPLADRQNSSPPDNQGTQVEPPAPAEQNAGRRPPADETSEPISRPALAASALDLGAWTVADDPGEGRTVQIAARFDLESQEPVDWCLAVRYQHGDTFVGSSDAASSVGGVAAAHQTFSSRSGRQTGEEMLSIPLQHLEIPLERLNARVRLDADLAAWPKECAAVDLDEAPLARSAETARVCLIRSAAGIGADPICRR